MLLTGMHTVADVVCIVCDEVVGWKYVCCMHLVGHLSCRGCGRAVAFFFFVWDVQLCSRSLLVSCALWASTWACD